VFLIPKLYVDVSWYQCSLAVVAREFLYYATKALSEDIISIIHIQGSEVHQFQSMLPYPIGNLKNLVNFATSIVLYLSKFDCKHDSFF